MNKVKVALYKNTTYKWGTPMVFGIDEDGEEFSDRNKDWARVSEIVEVEFPSLSDETVIRAQLDSLDKTEQQIRMEFQHKLNALKERRAELQALTFTPAESNS
jgi:hypothetical protein